jgi:hypothetical protein
MPLTEKNNERILLLFCAAVYVSLRAIAWNNAVILDDHDSTFYLKSINAYRSFDLLIINSLSAYSTPFYPFVASLVTTLGLSIETSARLVSFLFSLLMFFAFYGIGRKVTGSTETVVGLFLLAVSPALLPLAFAILTEPSYIATIYAGLLVFLLQRKSTSLVGSMTLGFIFGLAFLNRTEGILFIAVIPILQALSMYMEQGRQFQFKQYAKWCGTYGLVFSIIAAPQILHVSSKMDAFSLNGRVAWQLLENSDLGESRVEKQSGLHFRNDETNISFARRNYKEAKQLLKGHESKTPGTNYIDRAAKNTLTAFRLITRTQLGRIGSVLAAIGIIALFLSGRRAETLLVSGFAASTLAAPLLHADSIYGRHLLAATPALILFQAIGTVYLAGKVSSVLRIARQNQQIVISALVLFSLVYAVKPLYRITFKPPVSNPGYSIEEIQQPLAIIQEISRNELHRNPVIAAKKNYLAYYFDPESYSGSRTLYLPYTDHDTLVEYLDSNNADFLYLRYSIISGFPFLDTFERGRHSPRFRLLFSGTDIKGDKIELYRFIKPAMAEGTE